MHQPERTCLGCGAKRSKTALCRFAVDDRGILRVNDHGTLSGRGVYCCRNKSCLEMLLKNRRKLSKALRVRQVEVDEGLKGLFGSE